MVQTVVKTIGSGGNFSTLILWESGAPADLTTAEKSAAGTFTGGPFVQGEILTFSIGGSGTGTMLDTDGSTYIIYGLSAGAAVGAGTVVTGAGGATCTITSGTPDDTGVIWQGQMLSGTEITGSVFRLSMSGSTSSATCYKHITCASGASFSDNVNVQTNALAYNASNGAAIRQTSGNTDPVVSAGEDYCRFDKIMIKSLATTSNCISLGATGVKVDTIICEGTHSGSGAANGVLGISNTAKSGYLITNSLIIQRTASSSQIFGAGAGTGDFVNCTFVIADDVAAPTNIVRSGTSGTMNFKNCAFFSGSVNQMEVTAGATQNFTTCASDDSAPPSGVTGLLTMSSQFENVSDAARDFRAKSGGGLIDTGTTDSTNAPIDIAGTARPSGSAYDIGCWEKVQAAGGGGLRIIGDSGAMRIVGRLAA
ncbi:MAG: hypothetical protein ABL951_05620 [Alphaproteobacteria bacterium]